jgi:hypothetical protein
MPVSPAPPGHLLTDLTDLPAPRLHDPAALSAAAIAAGAAHGLMTHGTPVVRGGPGGTAVALLAQGGHVILHADPAAGRCLVDIVVPSSTPPERGLEVMIRRLGSST